MLIDTGGKVYTAQSLNVEEMYGRAERAIGPVAAILLVLLVLACIFIVRLLRQQSAEERKRVDELRNDRRILIDTIRECTDSHQASTQAMIELRRTMERLHDGISE